MQTLAETAYIDSAFGCISELPGTGSPLENPYVYDASARELRAMAQEGLVRIVDEEVEGDLISRLSFERLR